MVLRLLVVNRDVSDSSHQGQFCARWLIRRVFALTALLSLSGCFVVELNGPVAGAIIELSELRNPGVVLRRERSSDDREMIDELGEQAWDELPDVFQILSLGTFELGYDAIDPDKLYLLTASGGTDVDHDLDNVRFNTFQRLRGELYAITSGEQLIELGNSSGRVNLATTALYSLLQPMLGELTDGEILELLDAYSARMLSDVNRDGRVTYDDALRWSRGFHLAAFRHDAVAFDSLIELVNRPNTLPSQIAATYAVTGVLVEDEKLLSCMLESNILWDSEQDTLSCPARSIQSLQGLSGFPQIQHVDLSGNGLTAADLETLRLMEDLVSINLQQNQLRGLADLGSKPDLKTLNLADTGIESIAWLAALPALEELTLSGGHLENIEALAGAVNLQSLVIRGQANVTDWSVLSNFSKLTRLELPGSGVRDVSSLAELTRLEELRMPSLNTEAFDTLHMLAGLTRLRVLDLSLSRVEDISFVADMRELRELYLQDSRAGDWSALAGLSKLEILDLGDIGAGIDASPLAGLTALRYLDIHGAFCLGTETLRGLTRLEWLSIEGCQLSDISFLANMLELKTLIMSRQSAELENVDALANLVRLETLKMWSLDLDNIDGLSGLSMLTVLEMTDTDVAQAYGPLANLFALEVLFLDSTEIRDLSPLSGLRNLRDLLLINSWLLTDATPLYPLTNLVSLRIGPYISNDDIEALRQALPATSVNGS